MRLPRLIPCLLAGLLSAAPLTAAGQADDACNKDVFVYIDVSKTMRLPRGPSNRLQIFAPALEALLVDTTDFLANGDRVRVVTFSGIRYASFEEPWDAGTRDRLRDELRRIGNLRSDDPDEQITRTNLQLPLQDLLEQLRRDRPTYVIVASDLIDDPVGENDRVRTIEPRKKAFAAWFASLSARLRSSGPAVRYVLLDANTAGDVDAEVGEEVRQAFIRELRTTPITVGSSPEQLLRELKEKIGSEIKVRLALQETSSRGSFALHLTNPNFFAVRLTGVRTGNTDEKLYNEIIPCGTTKTIPIQAEAGAHVTVKFEVGGAVELDLPANAVQIDMASVRVLKGIHTGTLVIDGRVTKVLTQGAEITLRIESVPQNVSLHLDEGSTSQHVAISIPVNSATGVTIRSRQTARVTVTAAPGTVLVDETREGTARPYEPPVRKSAGDTLPFWLRWAWAFIIFSVIARIPGKLLQHAAHAAHEAGIVEAADIVSFSLATLYALFRPLGINIAVPQWMSWFKWVPAGLIAAIVTWSALRIIVIYAWFLIEPRGALLPTRRATRWLRYLTVTVWVVTGLVFILVVVWMESLISAAVVWVPS